MNTITAYQTDSNDLFSGPVICREDPDTPTGYRIPFGAYLDEPPPKGDHQIQKRVGGNAGNWTLVPDWRGHEYWLLDRTKHEISEAGIEPPTDALDADPGPSADEIAEKAKADLILQAKALLAKSDITVNRCYENNVPVPAEWRARRAALRAIARTGEGEIPAEIPYPAGTEDDANP